MPYAHRRMPEILVVHPPLRIPKQCVDYPYFAGLGLYQAAAVLRNAGWVVQVLDAFTASDAGLFDAGNHAWLGVERTAFLRTLRERRAKHVLINASPFLIAPGAREWLTQLIEAVRECQESVVVLADLYVGGMHYVDYDSSELLESVPGVRALLRYECEPLLYRLERELETADTAKPIVLENRTAFPLDEIPEPAFDLLDRDGFFVFLRRVLESEWRPGPFPATPARTLPLMSSRGCPYSCAFCSRNPGLPEPRNQIRFVNLERIEAWLTQWKESWDLERIVLLDEIPNAVPERFDSLLATLERLGLRLELPNGVRADLITEHHVRRLSRLTSGLKVSLESANERTQKDLLGKRLRPAAVENVAQWCHEAALALDVHCLLGIPGESPQELRNTVQSVIAMNRAYGARPLPQMPVPIRGTRLERDLRATGWRPPRNWDVEWGFAEPTPIGTPVEFASARQAQRLIWRATSPRSPKVILNLTYRCNNHCEFCAVGDREPVDGEVEKILETMVEYRRRGYEHLDIDGGEPTMHPSLPVIAETAKRMGYRHVTLVTNGRRLSYAGFTRRLVSTGLNEILISLHAPSAPLHEMLTSAPGSFEQTLDGIRNAIDYLPADGLAVNTTIVRKNLPHLAELGRLLLGMGVRRWNLQLVTPFGRARGCDLPNPLELKHFLSQLLGELPGALTTGLVNITPCLLPGFEHLASEDYGKASRDMVFVGADGTNLQHFLSERRSPDERCSECLYCVVCPGHYVFG